MKFLKNYELQRKSRDEFRESVKLPVVIILDNIRSGLNTGSVFRSADSFMAEKIFLCGITAQPPGREILKSALGATETVAWEYFGETAQAIQKLKHSGYRIFAVEQSSNSIPLHEFHFVKNEKYALIFGNEVRGVDESLIPLLDGCIEIPQSGTKHSLNISVCAGIVMWKFYETMKFGSKIKNDK